MVVIKTNENKIIGVVVDSIHKIASVTNEKITNTPDISIGVEAKYIQGLVQIDSHEMVTLLNIDTLLTIKELE